MQRRWRSWRECKSYATFAFFFFFFLPCDANEISLSYPFIANVQETIVARPTNNSNHKKSPTDALDGTTRESFRTKHQIQRTYKDNKEEHFIICVIVRLLGQIE